jgi:zinc transport system substrate-binding protein
LLKIKTSILITLFLSISFAKLPVVVSILPLAEFVEQVGGSKVDVTVLVPPGANPHSYEPTPGKMRKASRAKLIVKVGTAMEFEEIWLPKLLKLNKKAVVCDTSKGVELVEMQKHGHEEEGHDHADEIADPHIWLSPKNSVAMVRNIMNSLVNLDPKNKKYYIQNAKKYILRLKNLQEELEYQFSKAATKAFLIFHPAWGYLAGDFGLQQIPIEIGGKEPTARELIAIIKLARAKNIRTVFIEPQYNKKSARVIAKEIKGQVVTIDPLAKDYVKNLRKVAEAIINQDD